jgi:hypothetical protein
MLAELLFDVMKLGQVIGADIDVSNFFFELKNIIVILR